MQAQRWWGGLRHLGSLHNSYPTAIIDEGTQGMAQEPKTEKAVCGVVMPISAIDGCAETHWSDVLDIISDAVEDAGFEPNLVSNADDVGIIQKRIIQNLYDNPIVVCDVSGKNPNVMFELGMRLAFDKPTIIVKDDKTSYSFDTSPIEHLEYPRDLRFTKIVEFKNKLIEKIKATYEKSSKDENFTTFLKHFGEFKVAKLEKKEVSGQEFILDELRGLRMSMRRLEYSTSRQRQATREYLEGESEIDYCMRGVKLDDLDDVVKQIISLPGVSSVNPREAGKDHPHLVVTLTEKCDRDLIKRKLEELVPRGARLMGRSVVRRAQPRPE
jgi:hypothetical protein